MPESLPTGPMGAMGLNNLVRTGLAEIVSVTGNKPLFPGSRLLDPHRARDWRSLTATAQQTVKIRLADEALPRMVGLVDASIAAGQLVTLIGADDEAFTVNGQAWLLTAYEQSERGTLRWYPGNADFPPGAAQPHLYWAWILPANGSPMSYYRVGNIWMSDYLNLHVDQGYDTTVIDPSGESTSDGQSAFFDVRLPFQNVSASASFMTVAEARAFRQTIEKLGRSAYVMLDLWARSTDPADKADGCYYGLLGRRGGELAKFTRALALRENMAYEFTEARG